MKVYIVTSGCYSDYHIDQVFLNKEKAELYVKYHDPKDWDEMRIEEFDTADDYEPKDTYYCCRGTFYLIPEIDVNHPNGFYRTVFKEYKCYSIEKEHDYDCREFTDFRYENNELYIVRYYREQDYKGREEELQSKIEKIGYDISAEIINMLSEEGNGEAINEMLRGR